MSEAALAPSPGETFGGRYLLLREIGSGGVGHVWEAIHVHTGRRVAVKMLRARFAEEPRWMQRFLREARAVARIRHPNVVEVLDMAVGRAPYIVYELLEGDGLDARIAATEEGCLDAESALRALVPVAAALAAAHAEGIVHRDLKPSNVFLARDARREEVPKVIDFGLAKHTREDITVTTSDMVLGTPAYMAPEQARSEPDVDAQADVWSFGATLYECLTGALPVDGPNATVVLRRLLRAEVKPLRAAAPNIPDDVAAVVDRCLIADRARRFGSMREVVDALTATATWRRTNLPAPTLSLTRAERDPGPAHPPHATPPEVAPRPRPAAPPRVRSALVLLVVASFAAGVGALLTRWQLGAGSAPALPDVRPPAPAASRAAPPAPVPSAPPASPRPPASPDVQRASSPAPHRPSPRPRLVPSPPAQPVLQAPPAPAAAPPPSPPGDPLEPDRRYP